MTEQEKIELLKKETEENHRKSATILNKAEIKTILAGVSVSDELIESLVTNDKEKSIANATNLLNAITSIKEKTEKRNNRKK